MKNPRDMMEAYLMTSASEEFQGEELADTVVCLLSTLYHQWFPGGEGEVRTGGRWIVGGKLPDLILSDSTEWDVFAV